MIRVDRLAGSSTGSVPGMPEAHRADLGVGLGAELVRAAAEHLRRRRELDVALEADHRLVVGHQPVPAMIGGRRSSARADSQRVRRSEQRRLVERRRHQLDADGQPGIVQPRGDADGRHPREVRGDREDVVQVHRQRVVGLLADLERGRRRRRRDEHVEALEGALVVADHEGAHLLRLAVVRVVVAGRQRVGAEHDPALHLGAERLPTGREHHRDAVGVLARRTVAVPDAVVAREVRRRLRGGDQVVGRQARRRRVATRPRPTEAPSPSSTRRPPRATEAATPGSTPSPNASAITPTRSPFDAHARGRRRRAGPARPSDVASRGSWPAMTSSIEAASRDRRA